MDAYPLSYMETMVEQRNKEHEFADAGDTVMHAAFCVVARLIAPHWNGSRDVRVRIAS